MDPYGWDVGEKKDLEVGMKDFPAWLSCVHMEIRMRNFDLIVKVHMLSL